MTIKNVIIQLEDLICDRKSLLTDDEEHNEILKKDIIALQLSINIIKDKVENEIKGSEE